MINDTMRTTFSRYIFSANMLLFEQYSIPRDPCLRCKPAVSAVLMTCSTPKALPFLRLFNAVSKPQSSYICNLMRMRLKFALIWLAANELGSGEAKVSSLLFEPEPAPCYATLSNLLCHIFP